MTDHIKARAATATKSCARIPPETVIAHAQELVRETLTQAPSLILEITSHLAQAGGKGIRTVLLTHCATGGDGLVPARAAKAAAAIELLHQATLVHDDIIDDAPTRRGIASVQARFGKKQAVICGDWLLCMAGDLAASIADENDDTALARRYVRAAKRVCLGELEQNLHSGDLDLTPLGYLRIISRKTAALFCLAAAAGASIGGCEERQTGYLTRYALYLGMIFQIVDDLKDYLAPEQEVHKPVRSDLASGVITLPLILGILRNPALRGAATEVMRTGLEADRFAKQIQGCGGTDDALEIARRYGEKAERVLARVDNPVCREPLFQLLQRALGGAVRF